MLLLVDHRGPFLHNLIYALEEIGAKVTTIRHDEASFSDIESLNPSAIVLSSGLVDLADIRNSIQIVKEWATRVPILGIGLGMHCIAKAFGGRLTNLATPLIGKTSIAHHDQRGIFNNLATPITVARYDRAIVDSGFMPSGFDRCAWTHDGDILGIRHHQLLTYGLQFHPESIGTHGGYDLLDAFVNLSDRRD